MESLTDDHVLDGFTCGDDAMDQWLHGTARRANRSGSAAVTVCTHPVEGVVGFFALASHEVRGVDITNSDRAGLRIVPATLLARMGLSTHLRGDGLGAELLVEALRYAVVASGAVGSRLLVVDAKNEALAEWYQRMDFKRSKSDTLRLYMTMSTARGAVDTLAELAGPGA
ncbi:N-acetyltransferase [Mycobacteroides abscessus]|uniref:N-acetyltransferase n=1 Tax=Mycobacteroides abscessus TaxID=36809 RepID=UPI0011C3B5FA|nr:N-acetyltransferase [Mycobacteroides abscessus]